MEPLDYFPYEKPREGQIELISEVYRAISESSCLFVEAYSGFGKTSSVLSACLPFISKGSHALLYLVRTHRQIERVFEELEKMKKKDNIRASCFIGRREYCINERIPFEIKNKDFFNLICKNYIKKNQCKYYLNFKNKKILINEIEKNFIINKSNIYNFSLNLNICPYEYQKILNEKSNVIISTYNLILSREMFNYIKKILEKYNKRILIIDEAHNFIDYSLSIKNFKININEINSKFFYSQLKELIDTIFNYIQGILNGSDYTIIDIYQFIFNVFKDFEFKEISKILENKILRNFDNEELFKLYKLIKEIPFINDFNTLIIVYRYKDEYYLELLPLICPEIIEAFSFFDSIILASATLEPVELLELYLPRKNNKKFSITLKDKDSISIFITNVTSRFEERNEEFFNLLSQAVSEIEDITNKGIVLFFASHNLLEMALDFGILNCIKRKVLMERKEMSSEDIDKLLDNFIKEPENTILFSVQGGRIAEGEDLPSIADIAFLIGIPFEVPSMLVEERIKKIEEIFKGKGWEYAYLVPAIRKSVQAIGRVSRSPRGKCAIIFFDGRFIEPISMKYLPNWLKENMHVMHYSSGKLRRILSKFFNDQLF